MFALIGMHAWKQKDVCATTARLRMVLMSHRPTIVTAKSGLNQCIVPAEVGKVQTSMSVNMHCLVCGFDC